MWVIVAEKTSEQWSYISQRIPLKADHQTWRWWLSRWKGWCGGSPWWSWSTSPLTWANRLRMVVVFDEECNAGVLSCPQISSDALWQLECSKGKSTSVASNIWSSRDSIRWRAEVHNPFSASFHTIIASTTITIILSNINTTITTRTTRITPRFGDQEKGTISPPPLTRLTTLTTRWTQRWEIVLTVTSAQCVHSPVVKNPL